MRLIAPLLLGGILIPSVATSTDFELSGYGATGFKAYDREILRGYNQKVYYEGKLQAVFEIRKHIEAQLDFRGNSDDNAVNFREFSAKFELERWLKLKVGNVKKPFGVEQMTDKEELVTVDDSYIHRATSDMGYGGRSVMVMFYEKFSPKDERIPLSYYAAVYRNNASQFGTVVRLSYHVDDWAFSGGWFYQHRGGDLPITTHALAGDVTFEDRTLTATAEVYYVQDPEEGIRRRLAGAEQKVFAAGVRGIAAVRFDLDGSLVKTLEPVVQIAWYDPDVGEPVAHTLQGMVGVNIYPDKKVRLRLNADLLLTKGKFDTIYSTYDSRGTLELQVWF